MIHRVELRHAVAACRRSITLLIAVTVLNAWSYQLHAAQDRSPTETRRPNIVFFLADDLGWTGLSCFGSDLYETPHLDQLAADGVRFTDAYAACTVCSPSRAAIMTGKYPARLHLTDFIAGQNRPYAKLQIPQWQKWLRHEEVTIAEALGNAGYRTAHVGKWHLDRRGTGGYAPTDHGFDRQVLKPPAKGYFLTRPAGKFQPGDYTTDYLADEASAIIDDRKHDPFFLYFAFHVPHTPVQGKPELVERYARKVNSDATHRNPAFAAMVHSMDQAVGTVLSALDRNGIAENTLVVFTSDNGGLTQRYGKIEGFTDNAPLRRGKGSAFEGGVRVPTIVKWPGITSPGTTCDEPVIGMDFYPTLLEVAGVAGDKQHDQRLDGLSLVPLLREPSTTLSRDALYWHYPHYHAGGDGPYSAIRARDWRLVHFYEDDSQVLFNLAADVGERHDMSASHPEVVARLRQQLDHWRADVNAQSPTQNPNYDPDRASKVSPSGRN
jgi:arylsulfatase A